MLEKEKEFSQLEEINQTLSSEVIDLKQKINSIENKLSEKDKKNNLKFEEKQNFWSKL